MTVTGILSRSPTENVQLIFDFGDNPFCSASRPIVGSAEGLMIIAPLFLRSHGILPSEFFFIVPGFALMSRAYAKNQCRKAKAESFRTLSRLSTLRRANVQKGKLKLGWRVNCANVAYYESNRFTHTAVCSIP